MNLPPKQKSLFNQDKYKFAPGLNPKISIGKGPEGKTCKDCANCFKKTGYKRIYYKCKLLGFSNGPATDIRLKWPACYYFKEGDKCK